MKFLALLLSIYIFALNLAPCADYVGASDADKTEISQAIGDDHKHQDSDSCSPFCICQCCHISTTYLQFVDIKLAAPSIYTKDFFYLNGIEKDYTASILQPPKS
jgi:hypothetical protein